MRRILMLSIVLTLLFFPTTSRADHRPTTVCSSTGDICQSTARVDGIRKLRITLAAEFFSRYRLCITGPEGGVCERFRMRAADGGTFASSVRWLRHFPNQGPGAYTVTWRSLPGAAKVGSVLGFHVT
ncbi:MAG: hypothetical protein WD096_10220 [Actinomycetota bacterium]